MAGSTTQFADFLAEEIRKYKGVCVPVRANPAECVLVRYLPCDKLHPNPEDEFSMPEIGPSFQIISNYISQFQNSQRHGLPLFDDPIIVEKMLPDGYLILNGHHRWAAAMRYGLKRIPVKIVNLTQEIDIQKAIENSKHDRRVTVDLDEVVFRKEDDPYLEKKLPFPLNRMYKERLKRGIPALFRFLSRNGYDIWLFSAQYYSLDYIRAFFRKYHVHVDGIVTGTGRKAAADPDARSRVEKLMTDQYRETVNLHNDMVLKVTRGSKDFEQYDLKNGDEDWSVDVMAVIERFKSHEEAAG